MATVYYLGSIITIFVTDDGKQSIKNLAEVHNKRMLKELAKADVFVRTLGDTGRLESPDQFRQETPGFWAIRAGQIRLYGWYEPDGIFILSHAICKKEQKLAPADISRMKRNQKAHQSKNFPRR
jgi:hypothetical protein